MNANFNYDRELLRTLKNNYFIAKALYETIKEMTYEIDKKILEENKFYECIEDEMKEAYQQQGMDTTPQRILDPADSYMMIDDEKQFNKYLDLCYAEYVKAGIDNPKGRDWFPDEESRDLYWEARKQLVDYGIEIMPDIVPEKTTLKRAVQNIKWNDKVLDFILRLEC
jgi:hypothetical protein